MIPWVKSVLFVCGASLAALATPAALVYLMAQGIPVGKYLYALLGLLLFVILVGVTRYTVFRQPYDN